MQKRMLKVLIVFILIMTMTMSNFLLIGINVVNAVEQNVQDKIRACLLAGIRSAVLWRQVGGSKWQLLFHRKKLVQAARQLYLTLN